MVKKHCNDLEDICNGVFLLGEISPRTRDRIVSYGELLSSQIIAAAFTANGHNAGWKDARELIRTNSDYGQAMVDFPTTDKLIQEYFETDKHEILVIPGFISANAKGATTTLGRGGSDYTAAIFACRLTKSYP